MPIYEFQCLSCHNRFELLRSFGQKDSPQCPQCGGEKVRYIFSAFSLGSNQGSRGNSSTTSPCSTCRSKNCSTCG